METLQVALGRRSYPIYIGGGLLEQAEELLRPLGVGRWVIVCDDTVADLYGAPLARRTGWPLVTFPAGEGSKSLEEYDRLCRRLVQLGLTRSDEAISPSQAELLLSEAAQDALALAQHSRNLLLVQRSVADDPLLRQRARIRAIASPEGASCVERLLEPYPSLLERQLARMHEHS